jgi:hypothetical protein
MEGNDRNSPDYTVGVMLDGVLEANTVILANEVRRHSGNTERNHEYGK